jgi:hypothetical protein
VLTENNIEEHIPLLRAVGLLNPSMDSHRLSEVAFTVKTDSVVEERTEKHKGPNPDRQNFASDDEHYDAVLEWSYGRDPLEVIEEMTATERAALRERVLQRESKRKTPFDWV